jgi:hypothetical protein
MQKISWLNSELYQRLLLSAKTPTTTMTNENEEEKTKRSFWETPPGILTALADIITALGSCLAIVLASPRILDIIIPTSPTPERPTSTDTLTNMPAFTLTPVLCTERISLYNWWSPSQGDNFATTNSAWAGKPGDVILPDYDFVRLEGSVCSPDVSQPPGTVPLYSWWSPSRGDSFATTDPVWAGKPGDTILPDYDFVRLEGYLFP